MTDPRLLGMIAKQRNHPEQDFQDRVIALLELKGYRVHAERHARTAKGWVTPIQGAPGFPDIIAIREVGGWIKGAKAWELKSGRNKAMPDQVQWLELFERLGFDARVWHEDDWDEIVKLLEERCLRTRESRYLLNSLDDCRAKEENQGGEIGQPEIRRIDDAEKNQNHPHDD